MRGRKSRRPGGSTSSTAHMEIFHAWRNDTKLGGMYRSFWTPYVHDDDIFRQNLSSRRVPLEGVSFNGAGCKIMEDGEYYDLETGVAPHVPYKLIHSDIKPLNGKSILSSLSHASCVKCYRLFCGACCQAAYCIHCHYV
jgi:hypothetical protein